MAVKDSEAETDILKTYIGNNGIKVNDVKEFRNELYKQALDTIDNRIVTQAGKVPNELLYQYAENLFLGGKTGNKREVKQSEKCVLRVCIYRAEDLAPKDVNGKSDPYCMLGLAENDNFAQLKSKKQATKYVTSVKMRNLNPEWDECIEIPVQRSQISSTLLHIQIWDYDDAGTMSSTIGSLKDVKSVRGVGRYMKEVAQTMSKKDDIDDFMGFSTLPLKNIPLDGIAKWYQLRSNSALQGVSGRIKIGARLVCPHVLFIDRGHPGKSNTSINQGRICNRFPNDVIYGGILLLIVNGRHNVYKDLIKEDEDTALDGWDGQLQEVDKVFLKEFTYQRSVDKQACAIARWLIYCEEHIQLEDGIKMQFVTSLLKELETNHENRRDSVPELQPILPIAGKGENATVFVFDKLSASFDRFLRHCHKKIMRHYAVYPVKKSDTIMRLGELLMCMKQLREMTLYLTARLIDTGMFGSGDISKDISSSLRDSMSQFYNQLCVELKVVGGNIVDLDEGDPIERYNVPGLTKLIDRIHTDLVSARSFYQPVFQKVIKIDYMANVLGALSHRIATDLKGILAKVNEAIGATTDPIQPESADNSASMFQLYLSLRDFADFIDELIGGQCLDETCGKMNMDDVTDGKNEVQSSVQALQGFHNWFRPTILRWMQMSRGRTVQRLTAAVQLDKVERVDDIVKHSSSAVDAIACLSSVVTFWLQLKWPDPLDGFLIATRMTEDISNGVELYADLVHNKLKAVGFFDDEGQFDVTEELCLALNNLEKVKVFLEEVLDSMEIPELAAKVGAMDEGPSAEKMMNSFHALVRNADFGMRKKIQEVTSVVGKKMQADITKYLEDFADNLLKVKPKKPEGSPLNGHQSDYAMNRKEWERMASQAVGPLMNYLTTNIITLKEWLCDPNFRRVLDVLWKVCLQSFIHVFLLHHKNEQPHFFNQCKYILSDHLVVFYHADGEGLTLERMYAVEEYEAVDAELRMKGSSTEDLMRLFFSQMVDEQQLMADNPIYGVLNVYAHYDAVSSNVKVDVISAENLIPQDINGLSDPFVQISLVPKIMFPKQRTHETLKKEKTLDPFFDNESYSFDIDRDLVDIEGTVLLFTVIDYDIIGRNDLEGECMLPLNSLDGVKPSSGRGNRNYRLPLTRPTSSNGMDSPDLSSGQGTEDVNGNVQTSVKPALSQTTLELLQSRGHFDRDASEFYRWRKKLTDSAKFDDVAANTLFKSFKAQ